MTRGREAGDSPQGNPGSPRATSCASATASWRCSTSGALPGETVTVRVHRVDPGGRNDPRHGRPRRPGDRRGRRLWARARRAQRPARRPPAFAARRCRRAGGTSPAAAADGGEPRLGAAAHDERRAAARGRRARPPACCAEARAIEAEDEAMCRAMGRHGAELIRDGAAVLTHCNAGALATGGYGTALGASAGAPAGQALPRLRRRDAAAAAGRAADRVGAAPGRHRRRR